MLRLFNPIDIAGLAVLQARAEPDLAVGRKALAAGPRRTVPLGPLVTEWLPRSSSRRAWVLSSRGLVNGVLSVRRRQGAGAWEIDKFQIARGREQWGVELLEGLCLTLGRSGAERVLLRLSESSPVETAVVRAGFLPLSQDTLYVRPKRPWEGPSAQVRGRRPSDDFSLFQLYCASVPAPVRQAKGVTLGNWQAAEALADGLPLVEVTVLEDGIQVTAAAAVSKAGFRLRFVEFLVRPDAAQDKVVSETLRRHGRRSDLTCLVPDYAGHLADALERHGFTASERSHLYARQVVARVRRTGLALAGA